MRDAVALVIGSAAMLIALTACTNGATGPTSEAESTEPPTASLSVTHDATDAAQPAPTARAGGIAPEGVRADPEPVLDAVNACMQPHGWSVRLNPDGAIAPGKTQFLDEPGYTETLSTCLADASIPHVPKDAADG